MAQGATCTALRCCTTVQPRRVVTTTRVRPAARSLQRAVRLGAFNPNDPATWGGSQAQEPEPELQQLSDEALFQLLNAPATGLYERLPPTPPPQATAPKSRAPENAAAAIALGLELFRAEPRAALEQFVAALDLPGSGPRRTKGKPAELSTGELQAALFNAACCHAQLGEAGTGVGALRAAVEAGFDDWDALRNDADLAPLRLAPEWQQLAATLPAQKPPPTSFLGSLFGR